MLNLLSVFFSLLQIKIFVSKEDVGFSTNVILCVELNVFHFFCVATVCSTLIRTREWI